MGKQPTRGSEASRLAEGSWHAASLIIYVDAENFACILEARGMRPPSTENFALSSTSRTSPADLLAAETLESSSIVHVQHDSTSGNAYPPDSIVNASGGHGGTAHAEHIIIFAGPSGQFTGRNVGHIIGGTLGASAIRCSTRSTSRTRPLSQVRFAEDHDGRHSVPSSAIAYVGNADIGSAFTAQ